MLKNLKEIRKAKGMTQVEIAKELGVLQSSVSQWESGNSAPRMEHLIQLMNLLNCSADQLMR